MLFYCIENLKNSNNRRKYTSRFTVNQMFINHEEEALENYNQKCSKMTYGSTYIQIHILAYDYTENLGRCHNKWKRTNVEEGPHENTSNNVVNRGTEHNLSHATTFTWTNVMKFKPIIQSSVYIYIHTWLHF